VALVKTYKLTLSIFLLFILPYPLDANTYNWSVLEYSELQNFRLGGILVNHPYTLSTVYAKVLLQEREASQKQMQNESEKVDRARLAATKWLPMSGIGAAIPFVIGSIMQLPVGQVLIAAALTSTLVFSGLWMQSYGRERQYKTTA
jgi:hypothetical protein